MVVGERQRRALHQRLAEVPGVNEADVLMEHLPPSGWGDVARRSDLDHLERVLGLELAAFRAHLQGQIGSLRADMDGQIGSLRSDMRAEMATFRADLTDGMAKLSRSVIVGMASMVASLVGSLAVAAVTLRR